MLKKWMKTTSATALASFCMMPVMALESLDGTQDESTKTDALDYGIATPTLEARNYFLVDYHSGAVLAAKGADERQAPASLTKMMTSYVIGQALKQGKIQNSDLVTISPEAWAQNPKLRGSSLMYLEVGKKVPVSELNKGIIVDSGNDACIAMAQYVSGSQNTFIQTMNRYAQEMGLKNTHFMTVHGLDHEGQYSSARDMATIGWHLVHDLPQEYKLYAIKEFTFNGITQKNRNELLWDTSLQVDGLKTGHTNQAGYNLVASALGENKMRLISVVMGTPTKQARAQDSKKLLRWGFANFETLRALTPGKTLLQTEVYYGAQNKVNLGSLKNTYLTLPKGRRQDIKMRTELGQQPLKAPLVKGQVVGKMIYQLDGKDIATVDLQVLNDVNQGGIFSRLWDWVILTVKSFF